MKQGIRGLPYPLPLPSNINLQIFLFVDLYFGVVFCPLFSFKNFVPVMVKIRVQGSGFVFETGNLNHIR